MPTKYLSRSRNRSRICIRGPNHTHTPAGPKRSSPSNGAAARVTGLSGLVDLGNLVAWVTGLVHLVAWVT